MVLVSEDGHLTNNMSLSHQTRVKVPPIVLYGVFVLDSGMALFGTLGNFIVFLTILCNHSRMTITKLALLHLSVAHLLYLTVSCPLWSMHVALNRSLPVVTPLYSVLPPFSDIYSGISMLLITKLAIIRHNRICGHRQFSEISFAKFNMVVILFWAASIIFILVPRFLDRVDIITDDVYKLTYPLSVVFFWYVIPVLLLTGTYISTRMLFNTHFVSEWFKGSGHTALVTNRVMRAKNTHRVLGPISLATVLLSIPLLGYQVAVLFVPKYMYPYRLVCSLAIGSILLFNALLFPILVHKLSMEFQIDMYSMCYTVKKRIRRTRKYSLSSPTWYKDNVNNAFSASQRTASYSYIYMPHIKVKPLHEERIEFCEFGHVANSRVIKIRYEAYSRETVL